jgi:hypothetical protein
MVFQGNKTYVQEAAVFLYEETHGGEGEKLQFV